MMAWLLAHTLYFFVAAGGGFVGYAYGAWIKADVMDELNRLRNAEAALKSK